MRTKCNNLEKNISLWASVAEMGIARIQLFLKFLQKLGTPFLWGGGDVGHGCKSYKTIDWKN